MSERNPERLILERERRARTGISRTTAWRLMRAGTFPKPVHISSGRVAWLESEIDAWIAGLADARQQAAA